MLSKIDVSKRQLVTAINLLFENKDVISIYSLAANAWEVIDQLCNLNKVNSFSNQTRGNIVNGADLKRDYINSPYRNFFKHADRDPETLIQIFELSNLDTLIYLAVEDYMRMLNKSPIEFQVFQLWYLSLYKEKIASACINEVLADVNYYFPNILELPRIEQLALGHKILQEAYLDTELLNDEQTEVAI